MQEQMATGNFNKETHAELLEKKKRAMKELYNDKMDQVEDRREK